MQKMMKCKTCGNDIAKSAKVCPHCGAKQHQAALTACGLIIVFTVFFCVLILANGGTGGSSSAQASASNGLSNQSDENTPTEILNQDGIKVSYNGMSLKQYLPGQPEAYALYVGLTIENNSGADVTVSPAAQETSVNDVMKTPTSAVPMSVPSGKKITTSFFFANLDGTGINSADDIGDVECVDFKLSAYDSNFNELFTSGEIAVSP